MTTQQSPSIRRGRTPDLNLDQIGVVNNPFTSGTMQVIECGADGPLRQTVFKFTNAVLTWTDAGASGGQGSGKIYTFPGGSIAVLGAVGLLTLNGGAGIGATGALLSAVGTVTAAADATLSSTEANILPSLSTTLVASVGTAVMKSTTGASNGAAISNIFDGNTTAIDMFLNFAASATDSTANGTVTINGTIAVTWVNLGDVA